MTRDAEMQNTYREALREAEGELAGMDSRRGALQATIQGLKRLVADSGQLEIVAESGHYDLVVQPETSLTKRPAIPPDFFKGKKPTQAYRDFVRLFGEGHKPPAIRDAFIEGGMEATSKNSLLAMIHSVLARERKKKEKNATATVRP